MQRQQKAEQGGGDARAHGSAQHFSAAVRAASSSSARRRPVGAAEAWCIDDAPAAVGEHVDVGRDDGCGCGSGPAQPSSRPPSERQASGRRCVRASVTAPESFDAAREDLRPALAHRLESGQARALRMHADDLVVLGPHRHHGGQVAALEGVVEGGSRRRRAWGRACGCGAGMAEVPSRRGMIPKAPCPASPKFPHNCILLAALRPFKDPTMIKFFVNGEAGRIPGAIPTPRSSGCCATASASPAPSTAAAWRCAARAPCISTTSRSVLVRDGRLDVAGKRVTTIEGIGITPDPGEAREGGVDRQGRGAVRLLPVGTDHVGGRAAGRRTSRPSDADIDAAMSGNICRCGTYQRVTRGHQDRRRARSPQRARGP